MIQILSAKLAPYRSMHKFIVLYVLSTVVAIWATSSVTSIEVKGIDWPLKELFTFPTAWITGAAIARWNVYIPAFFVVQIVTAELELKLVRAQLIAGLERHDVVIGWTLQNVLLTIIGSITTAVAIAIFGNAPDTASAESAFKIIVASQAGLALYGMIFLSFAVLGANLFLKPVPAMVLLILGPLLEEMIAYILDSQKLGAVRPYLPFTAMAELAPMNMSGHTFEVTAQTMVAVGYGVLATFLAWLRLSKRDL